MADLVEILPTELQYSVEEAKGGKKHHVVRGVIQKADVRNGNNRIYPRNVLETAIQEFNGRLEGTTLGEADHPKDGKPRLQNTNSVHRKMWMDPDGTVWGESVIPETSLGRDLIAILEVGGRVGSSTRGKGSTRTEEVGGLPADVVEDGYQFVTWDYVVGQSVEDAMIRQHVLEQKLEENKKRLEEGQMTIKNLAEFREKHPDISEALRKECLEALAGEFETKFLARLNQEKGAIEERVREELGESGDSGLTPEDVAELREGLLDRDAILMSFANILSENGYLGNGNAAPSAPTEQNAYVESLQNDLKQSHAALRLLNEQVHHLRTSDDRRLVEAHINKVLDGEPWSNHLREPLVECRTVEEVDKRFETEKVRLKKLFETTGIIEKGGKGDILERGPQPAADKTSQQLSEDRIFGTLEQQKVMAGLNG